MKKQQDFEKRKYKTENQTLYFDNVMFNNCMIIDELRKQILASGGAVEKPRYYTYTLYRRHALEEADNARAVIKYLTDAQNNNGSLTDTQKNTLNVYTAILKKADRYSKPVKFKFCNYLTFVLDGFYYSFQLEDNPFFDNYVTKIKTAGDGDIISRNYYAEKFDINACYRATKYEIFNLYNTRAHARKVAIEILKGLQAFRGGRYYGKYNGYDRNFKIDFNDYILKGAKK